MSSSRSRSSRVFTVSFPKDLAKQVEQTAKEESRNVSELFREAFRTYRLEAVQRKLAIAHNSADARSRRLYSVDDVERLVDEVRVAPSGRRKTGN